jgi:hypothetical protein
MSTELDATEEAAPAVARAREGAPVSPLEAFLAAPTAAGKVLSLQRAAGNRAVGRLLRARARTVVVQRRRMPLPGEVGDILSDTTAGGGRVAAADIAEHQKGLQRLWTLAAEQLSPQDMTEFMAELYAGQTVAQLTALPLADQQKAYAAGVNKLTAMTAWEQQQAYVTALEKARPDLTLGDPLLIDSGPRPGTADAANIQKLVDHANDVFDEIAAGKRDADVKNVFGNSNLAKAKAKYAQGRIWMNKLHKASHVVTDRSGYNAEVGLGGLTSFHGQISLEPGAIDQPDDIESIVTMIHESMHAGNADVSDKGYIDQPSFTKLDAGTKLTNAAHFEVVPRRVLGATFQFVGDPFTPAGTKGAGGAVAPKLTPREEAIRAASEMYRQAWTIGLNLHVLFVRVLRTPTDWDTADLGTEFGVAAGLHFSDALPFWSKVMGLTIHERTHINPSGGHESTNPVTRIDVALSEGVIRKLSRGMGQVPPTDADADAFEKAKATPAELAAVKTVDDERDLLIRLVRRDKIRSVAGDNEDLDLKVVLRMGQTKNDFGDMLVKRAPASFP